MECTQNISVSALLFPSGTDRWGQLDQTGKFSAKLHPLICSEILGGIWQLGFPAASLQCHEGERGPVGTEMQQKGQSGGEGTGTAEGLGSAGPGISLQDPLAPRSVTFCTGEILLQASR